MSSKKKSSNNTKKIVGYSIISGVFIFGVVFCILGLVKLLNYELYYEEDRSACDEKDYSSLIKKTEVEVFGNDNINNQVELYKNAMKKAADANDVDAFAQLQQKYNELLLIQSQTKSTDTAYNYEEVNKAKSKCYKLASTKKDSNKLKGTIFSAIGLVAIIGSITALIIFNNTQKKH